LIGDAVSHDASAVEVIEVRTVSLQTAMIMHTAMDLNNPDAFGRQAAADAESRRIDGTAAA
jgi:hypothetical protein